jgi:hypothetical protein
MEMDINDFGLQNEAFGFGESMYDSPSMNYSQMARSNTEFLNFGEGRKQRKELEAIRQDYFKRIDALSPTDDAGRNALFNELETKLKEKGASFDEINETRKAQRKAERGGKILSGLTTTLGAFNKTTQALGIGQRVQGESPATSQSLRSETMGGAPSNKMPMWVWIVSGVAVVGLGLFAYYKFRR